MLYICIYNIYAHTQKINPPETTLSRLLGQFDVMVTLLQDPHTHTHTRTHTYTLGV